MKKAILIAILLLAAARPSSAQALTEYGQARNVVIDGDTVVLIQLSPSFVFRKAVDTRRFARLIYNLKRVYPIAKEANATLHAMEAHMETLATKREKQRETRSRTGDGFRIKRTSRPARLQTRSVRDNRPAARVTDRHGPDQHIAGTRIGRNSYF